MQYEVLIETVALIRVWLTTALNLLYLFLAGKRGACFPLTFNINAAVISKYSSESLAANTIDLIERVFPLEVCGALSRRFKVGNTAGEYTGCGSSLQDIYV
jgi:hypothetical protein